MQPPFLKQNRGRGTIRESLSGAIDPASAEKDALERQIEQAMMQYWQGQQQRIIDAIEPKVPSDRKSIGDVTDALDRAFWDAETQELLAVLLPLIQAGAEMGVWLHAAAVEPLGVAVDWTLAHTDAADWARRYGGKLVRGVTRTTRDRIGVEVANWIESGEPLPTLEKKLLENYGFDRKRARLIAQTETTAAFGRGEYHAARAVEKQGYFGHEKQWETVMDDVVCEICRALQYDGTNAVQGANGRFETINGDSLTTEPAHPGCRCWVNYVPVLPE